MELNSQVLTLEKQEEVQTQDQRENSTLIDFKMVTFSLSGKDYSIDIMHVKEIAKAAKISEEETLLGMGWLFKEGKIVASEDKIALA